MNSSSVGGWESWYNPDIARWEGVILDKHCNNIDVAQLEPSNPSTSPLEIVLPGGVQSAR
jgi:hypothetical protein